jgi:hypothetical protein
MHIPAGVTNTGAKDFDPDMRRDGCRANSSGGPQRKNPCGRTTNAYSKPRSANDTTPLPATMKWSSTRTSIKASDSRSVRVRNSSARLGSATPDGCAQGSLPRRCALRISAIVDAWNRLIVDGETTSPGRRWGSAQALRLTVA